MRLVHYNSRHSGPSKFYNWCQASAFCILICRLPYNWPFPVSLTLNSWFQHAAGFVLNAVENCMSIIEHEMQHLWMTLIEKEEEEERKHFPIGTHKHTQTYTHTRTLTPPLLIPRHLHRPRCSDGLLDNRDNGAAVFHIGPGVYYSLGLALFPKRSYTKSPNLLFSQPYGPTCEGTFISMHVSFDLMPLD